MKIRDRRDKEWFWIEKAVLDSFNLSSLSFYLYAWLCRYADYDTQIAYISVSFFAKKLGVGRPKIRAALSDLIHAKLIKSAGISKGYLATEYELFSAKDIAESTVQTAHPPGLDSPPPGPPQTGTRATPDRDPGQGGPQLRLRTKKEKKEKDIEPSAHGVLRKFFETSHQQIKGETPYWNGREGRALSNLLKDRSPKEIQDKGEALAARVKNASETFWKEQSILPSAVELHWNKLVIREKSQASRPTWREQHAHEFK